MAAGFSFALLGVPEMKARLQAVVREVEQAVAAALYQQAEAVMTESKQQCPVDTGRLRATGYVTLPQQGMVEGATISYPDQERYSAQDSAQVTEVRVRPQEATVSVELGYGTDYAVYVHERTDLRHDGVGEKAKFLEDPLLAAARDFERRLAEAVREALR